MILHLNIIGRVQGVGYRYWAVQMARSLGLSGWVRNRMDGSVEALVSADEAAVTAFIAHAKQGPAAARVDRIDQTPLKEDRALPQPFEQHATA
ncbi:acylphosphatase [Sphingobium sp. H39-3-25]|uniref:acylphosphatase n=1 Tax=Sphingobium arseniciresistens TaxID=3030834 RepID=UPI0023B90AFF|nr:acylphosphatase [Sphingobium arseniciresistens]